MEQKKEKKEEVYIEKLYRFKCKDCEKLLGKETVVEYSDKDEAQNHGWAIARGGKVCYCPAHAFAHRSTGCKGVKVAKSAFKQLTISEVANA